MPANKSIKCGKCDEPINKSGSIMCKLCSRWFHSKCVDLSDKDLQALSVIKCCAFICDACENNRNGSLEKKLDAFITKYDDDQLDIKNSLDTIRKDMATHLTELKADILECNKKLSSHKAQVSSKFLQQDIEINILHKRINRGDIIISGLPTGIQDLESTIISLGAFYKVDVSKFCYVCLYAAQE